MKKVLSFLLLGVLVVFVTAGFFVFQRFEQNPEQILPYPYIFKSPAPELKIEAPILIIGDRMGAKLGKFSDELAKVISTNLAKPIKVQSIARPGHALHRTIHELKTISPWPQILIYQGGSEEFSETKFIPTEIPKIAKNFKIYSNDKIETLLILYPWLSKIVYEPIQRVTLPEIPVKEETIDQDMFLKRLETEFLLFEQQLVQLVTLSKSRNSLLVLSTTPINLDEPPRKVCEFTTNTSIQTDILSVRDLLKENNPKSAYAESVKMIQQYSGNAQLLYIHGQICKRLGYIEEARNSLLEASAYDCEPWRVTEVHNSIIRKVARDHQVLLFDFAKLVEKDFDVNTTFSSEILPQNLYYDKGMEQLGLVLKSILKL